MGKNKLTRKEIMTGDPVHEALVRLIEFTKVHSRMVGIAVVAVVVLSFGIYGGVQYLGNREMQAQERLGKGIEFYHAQVSPDAAEDPYAKGPDPVFKSDKAKYQAAADEFAAATSGFGHDKVSIIASYYLGLAQLQLGRKKEAVRNFESLAGNSRNRTIGFLAKKVLARTEAGSGNYKRAREILEGMIKDPQCDIPKEDLNIELSRVLVAQGKRDEAIKVLRNAGSQGAEFSTLQQQVTAELERIERRAK